MSEMRLRVIQYIKRVMKYKIVDLIENELG